MKIFLVLFILVSFLSPVIATEKNSSKTEVTSKSKSKKKKSKKSAQKKAAEAPVEKEWSIEPLEEKPEGQTEEAAGEGIAPAVRELIILRAGAQKYIGHWDEVEKDALILKIQNQPLSDVAKAYTMIPSKILRNLKKQMQNYY